MTTLFSALDWRAMSQEARDLGLNNGVAVTGSAEMAAGWEQRSAEMRKRFPGHLDMRYGPRERNRIDFLKAGEQAPTLLFIHGGYWQARAKEVFTVFAEGPMVHGINVALIGYTLAPEATLDEIVAEIHAGIDFLAAQLPALGAAPGKIHMTLDGFEGTLREKNSGARYVAEGGAIDRVTVDSLRLDDLDLLKMGIEGSEVEALKGARQTLLRCRPVVLFEGKNEWMRRGFKEDAPQRFLTSLGAEKFERVGVDEIWGWRNG
jgi:hypothetical protein